MILTGHLDLTLLNAGGGSRSPPYHINVIPRKKLMGKVANFFLLFLNMRMEGWGLLFQSDYILCGREGVEVVKLASIS